MGAARSQPLALTIAQAAAEIGVSRDTIYRHIAAGDLDTVDVGVTGSSQSKTRVPYESLERFVKSRTRSAKRLRVAT